MSAAFTYPRIACYSRKGENYWAGSIRNLEKGNTEIVAEMIRDTVGGDLFEVDTFLIPLITWRWGMKYTIWQNLRKLHYFHGLHPGILYFAKVVLTYHIVKDYRDINR